MLHYSDNAQCSSVPDAALLHVEHLLDGRRAAVDPLPAVGFHFEIETVAAVPLRATVEALVRFTLVQIPTHVSVAQRPLVEEGVWEGQGLAVGGARERAPQAQHRWRMA